MNKDRRATAQVCVELIKECAAVGEMSEASHVALADALKTMQAGEYWSLRNMSKHAGRNESTDAQIAVSEVALPAIEEAVVALEAEDYNTVIDLLSLAITTEGKKTSKKGLRKKAK